MQGKLDDIDEALKDDDDEEDDDSEDMSYITEDHTSEPAEGTPSDEGTSVVDSGEYSSSSCSSDPFP